MQGIGFIIDRSSNEKLLLLVRQGINGRYLKLRKSGKDGVHFIDEEEYLNNYLLGGIDSLKNGSTVFC